MLRSGLLLALLSAAAAAPSAVHAQNGSDVHGFVMGMGVKEALDNAARRNLRCVQSPGAPKDGQYACKGDDTEFVLTFTFDLEPKKLQQLSYQFRSAAPWDTVKAKTEQAFGIKLPLYANDPVPRLPDGSSLKLENPNENLYLLSVWNRSVLLDNARSAQEKAVGQPVPPLR
jgi:hypothetical protein